MVWSEIGSNSARTSQVGRCTSPPGWLAATRCSGQQPTHWKPLVGRDSRFEVVLTPRQPRCSVVRPAACGGTPVPTPRPAHLRVSPTRRFPPRSEPLSRRRPCFWCGRRRRAGPCGIPMVRDPPELGARSDSAGALGLAELPPLLDPPDPQGGFYGLTGLHPTRCLEQDGSPAALFRIFEAHGRPWSARVQTRESSSLVPAPSYPLSSLSAIWGTPALSTGFPWAQRCVPPSG